MGVPLAVEFRKEGDYLIVENFYKLIDVFTIKNKPNYRTKIDGRSLETIAMDFLRSKNIKNPEKKKHIIYYVKHPDF